MDYYDMHNLNHFIANLRPFMIYSPFFVGFPARRTPSTVYHAPATSLTDGRDTWVGISSPKLRLKA